VFGTPIAGAIFGLEVLVLGSLMYDVLYPSFVAGIVGYHMASQLGVQYFHQTLPTVPLPSERMFGATLLAGVVFGLVALALIEATLEGAVRGEWVPPEAALMKILFTAVSLGVGGSGGIVTPIFFIGATTGSALAHVAGLDPATFSAIGMVALLAGAANAPLAASVMAIELFGPGIGPYAAISAIVAFTMSGHRSVYPSQVLGVPKTRSLSVRQGAGLGDAPIIDARLARVRWRALQRLLRRLRGGARR